MSPILVGFLLFVVLVVPGVGAVVLRTLNERMSQRVLLGVASLIVVLPMGSAIALSRANIPDLRVGNLSVVLIEPTAVPLTSDVLDMLTVVPEDEEVPHTHDEATATAEATAPAEPAATAATDATPEPAAATPEPATATPAPATATPEPATATPEPATATPEPATATPAPATATPAPAVEQRRYTVQQGDTLKSIAEQFNVSVANLLAANGLTAEQADSLRVGQELVIP